MTFCFWWAIFFLLGLIWELFKAIWWIIPIVLILWGVSENVDEIKKIPLKVWKRIGITIVLVIGVVLLVLGFESGDKYSKKTGMDAVIANINNVDVETVDTLQLIVDARKDSIYEGNIFAGLHFGINKAGYDRVMQNFKRDYNNELVFPTDKGRVLSYRISWVSPKFYNGKLYEVEVKIDNSHAYYELEPVFENKYGWTKHNYWEWKNVEIRLSYVSRRAYDPSGDKGYGSSNTGLYYEYSGSTSLTSSPGYTTIKYKDLSIYQEKRREDFRNDSIRKEQDAIRAEKKRQKEREKASRYRENI